MRLAIDRVEAIVGRLIAGLRVSRIRGELAETDVPAKVERRAGNGVFYRDCHVCVYSPLSFFCGGSTTCCTGTGGSVPGGGRPIDAR